MQGDQQPFKISVTAAFSLGGGHRAFAAHLCTCLVHSRKSAEEEVCYHVCGIFFSHASLCQSTPMPCAHFSILEDGVLSMQRTSRGLLSSSDRGDVPWPCPSEGLGGSAETGLEAPYVHARRPNAL